MFVMPNTVSVTMLKTFSFSFLSASLSYLNVMTFVGTIRKLSPYLLAFVSTKHRLTEYRLSVGPSTAQ